MRFAKVTILKKLKQLDAAAPRRVAQLVTLCAVVMAAFGAGMSYGEQKANFIIAGQAAKVVSKANHGQNVSVPATAKPSTATVDSYTVPADHPRYLDIPALGVHARVLPVGLTADGAIGTPGNVYDTGWYNGSAKPGLDGAMLIDGHISSWTTRGVFYGLSHLVPGDKVQVQSGDGTEYGYSVVKVVKYDADNVDMSAVLSPVSADRPGLNLISCAGSVTPGTSEFNQRIVVYTQQD